MAHYIALQRPHHSQYLLRSTVPDDHNLELTHMHFLLKPLTYVGHQALFEDFVLISLQKDQKK